jgi:hypothetical protein
VPNGGGQGKGWRSVPPPVEDWVDVFEAKQGWAPRELWLLTFWRPPPRFFSVLDAGPDLAPRRDALKRVGRDHLLPCGARAFVVPGDYDAAVTARAGARECRGAAARACYSTGFPLSYG